MKKKSKRNNVLSLVPKVVQKKKDQHNFIDDSTSEKIYQTLCSKARKLSEIAKLKNCEALYHEKGIVLSKIIESWPERIELYENMDKYWHITLKDFGRIHVDVHVLSEFAKKELEMACMLFENENALKVA
jgi:hypothetical protein